MSDIRIVFEGRAEFARGITNIVERVDNATRLATGEACAVIQRQAMENSSGRPGPNVVSGSHRRSFVITGPARMSPGEWVASVGPTMVYSRRLELGGGNWPPGLRFPYWEPALAQVMPSTVPAVFRRRWAEALAA